MKEHSDSLSQTIGIPLKKNGITISSIIFTLFQAGIALLLYLLAETLL